MHKVAYFLTAALILASIAGAAIGLVLSSRQAEHINEATITLSGNTQSSMELHLSDLVPGESLTYTVHLKARRGDVFDVSLDFKKTGLDSLAPYVDVAVLIKGERVIDATLAELLAGEATASSLNFDQEKNLDIVVIYSMKQSVGDEAQGTIADFELVLTSKRQ